MKSESLLSLLCNLQELKFKTVNCDLNRTFLNSELSSGDLIQISYNSKVDKNEFLDQLIPGYLSCNLGTSKSSSFRDEFTK